MKQLAITTYGMNILRKKTRKVSAVNDEMIDLVRNMFYTMDKASGIGLAAPQVNLNMSLAIIDLSGIDEYKDSKPLVLINPEIVESHGKEVLEEGCLSIPGVRGNIERAAEIHLRYNDFDMNEINTELSGFIARVAQHEIDHLNGKLFIDYLTEDEKKEIRKDLLHIKKGDIEIDYPLLIHSQTT